MYGDLKLPLNAHIAHKCGTSELENHLAGADRTVSVRERPVAANRRLEYDDNQTQ